MRTFKGQLVMEFKAVVPDSFLTEMRHAAEQEDASPFLLETTKRHPTNDDAFVAAILSNGIRHGLRHDLLKRFGDSQMGGTVAPGSITITEHVQDHDAPAAVPQVIKVERKIKLVDAPVLDKSHAQCCGGAEMAALYGDKPDPVSDTPLADADAGRSHGGVD